MSLVTVLDELRIKSVVLLGDGAGAYTALRYTRRTGFKPVSCLNTSLSLDDES